MGRYCWAMAGEGLTRGAAPGVRAGWAQGRPVNAKEMPESERWSAERVPETERAAAAPGMPTELKVSLPAELMEPATGISEAEEQVPEIGWRVPETSAPEMERLPATVTAGLVAVVAEEICQLPVTLAKA